MLLLPSSNSTSKPKGVPIDVPKNERRLSNFSLKTANRALMTGYRDGGHAAARRKSSLVSIGSKSPPFLAHKGVVSINQLEMTKNMGLG